MNNNISAGSVIKGARMTPSTTKLGRFIRTRRLKLKMPQTALAKLAGYMQNLVSAIEIGERKFLGEQQLAGLAKALQCDQEELRRRMPVKPIAQPQTELGKLIHSRREELGMTIETFAKKIKMTPERAKHLEVRKNPSIRYTLVKPLAKALKLDPSLLSPFGGQTRKETKSELGQLVRTRRRELCMSLETLAKKIGATRQFVNQIEFGQTRLSGGVETLARLAKVLGLDIDILEAVRPQRRLKTVDSRTGLGVFLATRRFELHLTQREVAELANIGANTLICYETGRRRPTTDTLDKLAKVLDCQVPPEIIPPPHVRKNGVNLASSLADLERIKELANIGTNTGVVRRALKTLRLLLEKQNDKHIVCLRKDGNIVELEFPF